MAEMGEPKGESPGGRNESEDERQALDVVTHLVKAAIGESKLWVNSYEVNWNGSRYESSMPEVKLTVQGDVNGAVTLSGPLARRVMKVMSAYRLPPELDKVRAELRLEKDRNAALVRESRERIAELKGRLARLHALSDPDKPGTDFES